MQALLLLAASPALVQRLATHAAAPALRMARVTTPAPIAPLKFDPKMQMGVASRVATSWVTNDPYRTWGYGGYRGYGGYGCTRTRDTNRRLTPPRTADLPATPLSHRRMDCR